MYLWTQQDHFGHTRVEAFHFGLWYICRENDELMVFSVLCYRRITRVRRGRRKGGERGSLSETEWIYRESERKKWGRCSLAAAIWLLSRRKSRKVEQEKRGKGECGKSFGKDVKEVLPFWRS